MIYSERQLDKLIAKWHDRAEDDKQPLHEFLGWTWEQYKTWLDTGQQPK